MKTTAEKIAVMRAFLDGKPVEVRYNEQCDAYFSCDNPMWLWDKCDYRVKQGPLVKWVVALDEESKLVIFFDMKESALNYAKRVGMTARKPRVIKMTEVPE